jgi:hypothetical protein
VDLHTLRLDQPAPRAERRDARPGQLSVLPSPSRDRSGHAAGAVAGDACRKEQGGMNNKCGLRIAECGMEARSSIPQSEIRSPQSL